ncbi:30S ribosome-binding factor RbfA [Ethanoligenens harbinense]|uniref:Ribosome-binding factor A n=1 Tax=Ethanoligenens harbinense (strain DSM 18485 / JCM 12961 / CGMCC 1.5033 / YUAN-3) TaxID=663278 RepID=E6U8F5_ETHHY|nr:30S ribosome-binding factor RbfA [Ethanoligenens harbinense]ADU28274.1 ribosome-binding factor A [Ethanoligenens harbinense YUAN-3]AVQ97268.1 30S ribosome-binding factor RbfA [Ethanoligenens harbinense YUAN-3]AYF39932.1 30S ribosome-binding factor RbfA [Ethanoligenens harbinense]AYF42762.1 30S ribosome-binding factor RbfA [Ethanoligenens harbinense]QCN93512.1 30S ribosome-binding factor RbfA [Ethanoligenens harbinense]
MPGYRLDRLTEDIKRELSDIVRGLKDPRISGLVSIVRVDVSNDLSYAKVYVSAVGGDTAQAVEGLKSAAGFARKTLSARLHVRKTPELRFVADDSMEHSAHIAHLLQDIKKDEEHGQI